MARIERDAFIPGKSIAMCHKREIMNDRMQLPDIGREDAILTGKFHKIPHIMMRRL